MNLEDNIYYIVIHNQYSPRGTKDQYHLEKVFTRNQILEIIDKESGYNFKSGYITIVTNDESFLDKYLFTINLDEFKLLCWKYNNDKSKMPEYDSNNIRINCDFFHGFSQYIYQYFLKILNDDIISASQYYTEISYEAVDFSGFEYVNTEKHYEGWRENIDFIHFITPERYRKNNDESIFHNNDYTEGNIETFKKLLNVNILEIGTDLAPNINWEWCNGRLRYFDKISNKRLYITEELLQFLRNDNTINFLLKTTLDKNFYIEYYVTGLDYPLPQKDNKYKDEDESNSSKDYTYDKYKGAYGYDDDSIDNAFEGDPENYWNID
ncbi:hypothetical protein C8C85_1996 [Flavobacterium sp. 103]|uniref:hypothetical protein n=1 Tax=Flavobacterium sp. 103 TaxID=2135624 RepID=UPI000D5F8C38|nr:hypothetical protein [Flavobacterium sp. 103]PVX46170.1 hypothetical protein C8C85_1996 [Flavobacterium sp. 103]